MPSDYATPSAPLDPAHSRRMLYTMWLAMFFVFLEWTLGSTFMPIFLRQKGSGLGLTPSQSEYWLASIMALPSFAMFLSQPIWGMYADRHGRKPVVIISVVCTSLLRACWAFAHTPLTLLLLGIGAGILGSGVVVGQALVASQTPRHKMGEVMGQLATAMTMGFLIGPVVGQALAGWIGPRPTFLVQALFALIGAVTVWLFVEERFTPQEMTEPVGLVRAVTRDLQPLVGNRQLQALWGMVFTVFLGWSAMWPIMTYFVLEVGVPERQAAAYASYIMLISGSLQTLLAPMYGKAGDRSGHKRVLVAGTAGSGFFIALHYFVHSYAQFFGLRILAMGSGAAVNPATSTLAAHAMPRSRYGGAYGVLASARSLAGGVGALIGGNIAASTGIRWVFVWTGAVTLLSAAWAYRAIQEPPRGEEVRPGPDGG
jgi:MFS transporter, DHA1 family, multidrug resistance protein